MDILSFVGEEFIILVPILYILGAIIKQSTIIKDKYINIVLMISGIIGSVGFMGPSSNSISQGILAVGLATLGNQTLKQLKKDE